jgi:hypothetical protein
MNKQLRFCPRRFTRYGAGPSPRHEAPPSKWEQRVAALDTPVPFAKALEAVFSPKGRLLPALRELLAY